jgi:hypothetical protein
MIGTALALGACGGGSRSGGGSAEPPATTEVPATTVPPVRIDVRTPIPGGSLHGTPRPALDNTGTDYVAITESLVGFLRWLAENPDPRIVKELYAATEMRGLQRGKITRLRDSGWHSADEGYHVLDVRVVDVTPGAVSMRITDAATVHRVVDASGRDIGEPLLAGGPRDWSVLLVLDDGRWRIADARTAVDPNAIVVGP